MAIDTPISFVLEQEYNSVGESLHLFTGTDNTYGLLGITDGKIVGQSFPNENNKWGTLTDLTEIEIRCDYSNISNFGGYSANGWAIVKFLIDGIPHVCYLPNDNTPYTNKAANRLYYATDTDKMYRNIADTWYFVGTPDHKNLHNIGTITHDEIEAKLLEIEDKMPIIEFTVKEW